MKVSYAEEYKTDQLIIYIAQLVFYQTSAVIHYKYEKVCMNIFQRISLNFPECGNDNEPDDSWAATNEDEGDLHLIISPRYWISIHSIPDNERREGT